MKSKKMDFDKVLEEIGEFGRYQKMNYLLICLPVMFAAANSLSYVFTAGTPSYRCVIPECESNETQLHPSWLVNATPGSTDKNGVFTPQSCYRYKANVTKSKDMYMNRIIEKAVSVQHRDGICPKELFNSQIKERCSEWIFDPEERTIVQEWQLTCQENVWRLALVGTVHFAGLVVGTALSGYFADLFGRKGVFISCIVFMSLTGIAQGLSWNYITFIVFAFLNAIGTSGVYPLAFILGVEMVGPRKREMSSNVLNYFYAVGEALVGLSAWLLHDWQLLQYVLSVPPLIFIVYYWIVPESVRWLIAKNQRHKASIIIQRAAQVNRKELSMALVSSFNYPDNDRKLPKPKNNDSDLDTSECTVDESVCNTLSSSNTPDHSKTEIFSAIKQVFKSKSLILRYTIMLYIWAINAVVFYGLSLNSINLSGNKYLNFSLVCLIEIPGYTLAWFSLQKFGRRLSLSGSLFLCAVTCVAGGYLTKVEAHMESRTTWIIVTLFLIGKLAVTSAFAVIYTYTAEMMPTVIRSGGVGVMSTFARFGAMLAPFVPLLGVYYEALPLLLFGAASFSAGILALLLPETFSRKLPDTVEEAKKLGKKYQPKSTEKSTTPEVENSDL